MCGAAERCAGPTADLGERTAEGNVSRTEGGALFSILEPCGAIFQKGRRSVLRLPCRMNLKKTLWLCCQGGKGSEVFRKGEESPGVFLNFCKRKSEKKKTVKKGEPAAAEARGKGRRKSCAAPMCASQENSASRFFPFQTEGRPVRKQRKTAAKRRASGCGF